jgi:hypothetical protein
VVTVVMTDALLLAAFESLSLPDTLAVLMIEPSVVGVVITMVTVAAPPFAREASAQVTVAVSEQVPCDGVADWKVTVPGSESVTVTSVAPSGPLLVTVR